ncbi:MAG: MptD family putative ECF transporter S component [Tissierellia bacterium]|nr:MptD family putative ECF transporter S component [Tissierellia bacterium]
MKEKMQIKDYITIGLILAIYFIGYNFMVGTLVVMSTKLLFFSQGIASLILAPLYMLFVAKVQKKWAILTFGAVMVTILLVTTGGLWPVIFGYIGVIIAEFISRSGNYKSFIKNNIGYIFFSYWFIGVALLYYFIGEKVLINAGLSDEHIRKFMAYITIPNLIIGIIVIALCAFIGGFIGRAMLKKHFERAGIV